MPGSAKESHATNRHHNRRISVIGVIIALGALLTACSPSGGGSSSPTPTATSLPSLPTAVHISAGLTGGLCNGALGSNLPSVYAFSQSIYASAAYALSYPAYTMPANTPLKPFKLAGIMGEPAVDQQLGGAPSANPTIDQSGGILFSVCNNGSQPVTLSGVGMGIASFTSRSGSIDTWQGCDGAYQPGIGVTGGGCGGAIVADENMRATFPASASQGATVSATMISADGPRGYGPLPVTLQPGSVILITIAVTMPTAPGTYTLALTLSASGVSGPAAYAPLTSQLFAPVAHKWNGENCKATAMLSQIPASDTSSYYICPA